MPLPRGASRQSIDFLIEHLTDGDIIRRQLRAQVDYTAYALGQLEPGLIERTHWFRAQGETGTGLALHSRGGLGDATFLMGSTEAVEAILSIHPGPQQTYLTCQPQHLDSIRSAYRLSNQQPMIRMGVKPDEFKPVKRHSAVRLSGLDVRRINGLYSSDGAPSFYAPEHIDTGIYFGVFVEGNLVSIAGTHVVSPQERVAVVGNVFSHPAARGRGYATATTSAVTEGLLEMCDTVVLTVDPKNTPAVASYRRLGYEEKCALVEASGVRRDPAGLGSFFRRVRAGVRGRRHGRALVSLRR